MQALRSIFARSVSAATETATTTLPSAPVELDAQQLQQVSGGLPRVGGFETEAAAAEASPTSSS